MDMEETVDNAVGDVINNENHQTEQAVNGNAQNTSNGNLDCEHSTDNMDIDAGGSRGNSILANPARFECLIRFGRSLHVFATQLEQEKGRNEANSSMLQEAFSLLAYADPWDSPVGGQLDPSGREQVCAQLNTAILESKNLPGRPPLEISLAHSAHLLKLMSNSELGACAFADIQSILN